MHEIHQCSRCEEEVMEQDYEVGAIDHRLILWLTVFLFPLSRSM
jgi:hypothetical protein